MREFAFELALCARREGETHAVLSRQLGASVAGTRVIDVVEIEPGPEFAERVALTPHEIPSAAIEADVGAGEARYWRDCFDTSPEYARSVVERAVEVGFFERERRSGRDYIRQAARYPDWVGPIRGIENKPDLGRPGDLELQLRRDVSLALFDEVVLATASYVTRAHLNRIPPEVGVWRFDPETGAREVIREPTPLDPTAWGLEILEEFPGRTDVRPVSPGEKARQRRRLAERAYGKGWRVRAFPACANARVGERFGAGALPACAWKGDLVHPAEECGAACPGYEPADPPDVDVDAERARRTPWDPDPRGRARRQSGLDRFLSD
jgi:hypothetical protein